MCIDYGILKYAARHNINHIDQIFRITKKNYQSIILHNHLGEAIEILLNFEDVDYYVGDFVKVDRINKRHQIIQVFKRESVISKAASTAQKSLSFNDEEQIIAANVDQIFILISADQRFTLSKFERYLLTFSSMVKDLKVIISKSDYVENADTIERTIAEIYPHIKIYRSSIFDKEGILAIQNLFTPNQTSVLLGSSGAGKSTLINYLLDDVIMETQAVREDGKGKHTTTASKLVFLNRTQSYVIDTPGFKTISTHRDIDEQILFDKITEYAKLCKFSDCTHNEEPGCAIQRAIEIGELSRPMYERYLIRRDERMRFERFQESKRRKRQKPKSRHKMKIITNYGIFEDE